MCILSESYNVDLVRPSKVVATKITSCCVTSESMINMTVTVTLIYKSGEPIPPNNPPQLLLQTLPGKLIHAPIIDLTIILIFKQQ